MRSLLGWAAAWIVCVGSALPLAAQQPTAQPAKRQGPWFSLSAGPGWSFETCGPGSRTAACNTGNVGVVAVGQIVGGATLRRNLLVGAELGGQAWYARAADSTRLADVQTATLSLVAQYYPFPSGDLFVRAGGGGSLLNITTRGTAVVPVSRISFGWGVVGALGYDLRFSRKVSLTVQASTSYIRPGTAEGLVGGAGWRQWSTSGLLGLTFH